MRIAQRQHQLHRPASFSMASLQRSAWAGVAFLLAFLLLTHSFWCVLGSAVCADDIAPRFAGATALTPVRAAVNQMVMSAVGHSHVGRHDACANTDETKNRAVSAVSLVCAPLLLLVIVVYVMAALKAMPLPRRASVFGRDGPVSVPPLHSRLVRASLPHRAPPVFLF